MTAYEQLHQMWIFFLQGFHLYTHPGQTLVTFLFFLAFSAAIGSSIVDAVKRIKVWIRILDAAAVCSPDDFGGMKNRLGHLESTTATAAGDARRAQAAATAAVATASDAANKSREAISVLTQDGVCLGSKLVELGTRLSALENAPTTNYQEQILELSNQVDALTEEVDRSHKVHAATTTILEDHESRLQVQEMVKRRKKK
jgi:hypothetical protein